MKLELELNEVKLIVAALIKSDPLELYAYAKPLVEKIQRQADSQKPEAMKP